MSGRVLVAGIGNIFLGDDGFGVEVAQRMAGLPVPDGVRVADFGIRGVHLAYELLDGYDVLVLVDAVPLGEAPGTLAVVEPEPAAPPTGDEDVAPVVEAHTMSPGVVLGMLAGMGGTVGRILIVGCEPASLDEGIGLSPPVAPAVSPAVDMCRRLLADITENAENADITASVGKEARG